MSLTQGELSGAQPTQGFSACEHSLTHITHGAGASVHQIQNQQLGHYPTLQERLDESAAPSTGAAVGIHQQLPGSGLDSSSAQPLRGSNFFKPPLGGPSATVGESQQQGAASPQDFLFPPRVYDNSLMLKEQGGGGFGGAGDHEENVVDDQDDGRDGDFDDMGDGNSQGSGKRSRVRRPHLQGRFSGRLTTKEDERRLAEECKLLGPLLGGVGKRGDKSRLTLAKIVRGIATGDVRRFCEERERAIAMLKAKLAAIDPEAAASVPVNAIPLPSAALGGPLGALGGSMGGMGLGLGGPGGGSMGGHSQPYGGYVSHSHSHHATQQQQQQLEALQRENVELQGEAVNLRMELQARERLLLELQDTGIISGFVPTSIPLDNPSRGAMGGGGGGGGARSHSTDLAPPAPYGLPPRHPSYGTQQQPPQQPMASYGGPSQMSVPQSSAHMSGSMEPGPMGGGAALGGLGHQQQQQQLGQQQHHHQQQQPHGGMPLGGGSGSGIHLGSEAGGGGLVVGAAAMPAMSEHSRAGRPMKRQALPADLDGGLGGAVGGGGGGYCEVQRSLSHPQLGGGRGGGGGGYGHIDLQQQLNSLQAQVEHLQHLSQNGARAAVGFAMPPRERGGPPLRMPGGPAGAGAAGGMGSLAQYAAIPASPFVSSNPGPQGGLVMLPGGHSAAEGGAPGYASAHHPHHPHTVLSAPLHMQMVKPSMYDDVPGGQLGPVGGRDMRDTLPGVGNGGSLRHTAAAAGAGHEPDVGYGAGGGGGLESTLEHIFNSRNAAMRGEYDLPLELILPQEGGKGGAGGGGSGGLH
ncbi:hypothetical protein Agub_g8554 [Astrephomene gubernaculifera]|uniref:Uncharacterized protein n=1 Tax=Astrephomene gubernaculifera TaxID=47775 RepID=A0AAD3DTR3_9CHLO|nr:hypothetical protein Agub_g8554 [Astrephomene gubernaculifera]